MTDTADNAPEPTESTEPSNADAVAAEVESQQPERFDFVLDKYRADGRTEQESAYEQAKAYTELQSRFGSFTGAPDEYEISLDESLSEHINLDDFADDPIMAKAKEMAKEWGMNNEGFNQMASLYFMGQMADLEAADAVRAEEMKALGNNADRRLQNIQDWAKVNLSADTSESLVNMMTTAAGVEAIEALIAKTRNTQQVQDAPAANAVSPEKLREMMTAKDEFGNDKMSDPAYAAKVRRMYGQVYGEEPNTVTVGG